MARALAARLLRRPAPRLTLDRLEDRVTPALFTAQPAQTPTGLSNNGHVLVGDFNNDKLPDIVVTNYGTTPPAPSDGSTPAPGQNLTVMLGLGNGQFKAPMPLLVGSNQFVSYADTADLDGDGNLDLVCVSSTTATEAGMLTVFKGLGDGNFAKVSQQATGGSNSCWVGLGQVTNGDTKLDLIVASFGRSTDSGSNLSGNNAAIFQGDGALGFSLINTIAGGIAFIPTSGAIADFDGDGSKDVVFTVPGVPPDATADQPDGSVQFFQGNGAGGFTAGSAPLSGGPLPINMTVADLNADGKPDLVVANAGNPDANSFYANFGKGTAVGVLINAGSGVFNTNPSLTAGLTTGGSTSAFAVSVADFNLDGKPDIAAVTYGHPLLGTKARVAVYTGDGKGNYTPESNSPYTTAETGGQFLAAGDFDGNNSPDLVVVGDSNKVQTLLNQSVAPASTFTALQTSASPAGYGTNITFTATVSSAGAAVTAGTVTFFDGAVQLGSGTPDAAGQVTVSSATLSVGNHPITAQYGGASGFSPSTSVAVTQVISQASTATTLQAPTSALVGDLVTFTATVSSLSGTPTGSVNFFDGGTKLGSITLGSGNPPQAVFSTSSLTAGTHLVTAVYAGTTNYALSSSNTVSLSVTNPVPPPVTPSIGIASSANPSNLGGAVTFTVTLGAATGTPTGTVTFFDGGSKLGNPVAVSGTPGKATFTTSTLAVGSHAITAQYSGDTAFNSVTSSVLTQTVNPTATNVAIATDVTPATITLPVTFTATVSAVSTPLGAVQFFDGATAISGLLPLGAGNKATFTTAALPVGSHAVTAQFVPASTDFAGSTSPALTQVVKKADLDIAVTSPGAVLASQSVTLTAQVTKLPGIAPDLAGLVTFKRNGVDLGTAAVSSGKAQLTVALPVGDSLVTAEYAGDANFSTFVSPAYTQTVNKGGVTVSVASGGPVTVGLPISFLVTVAENTALTPDPSGQVAIKLNGATIGTATLDKGSAVFTTSTLPVGTGTITAEFAGDTNFLAGASAPLTQQVVPINTAVSIGTTSSPATVSVPVALTATIGASSGTPAGTVQFFSNGTAISGLLPVAGGKATLNTGALPVGTSKITAQFTPSDPSFAGSTSLELTQVIQKAAPAVTVNVDVAAAGQPSTLRATVARPNGVTLDPGGTVTFKVNGAAVGTAALVGGQAATTSVLPVGTNTVSVEFNGDGNFTTNSASTTATVSNPGGGGGGGGGNVQKPNLVGYPQFGVGAGSGHTGDARFFNPDASERFTAAGLFSGTGGVRVASADFNGDGVADLIAGTGPGGASHVVVLDGKTRDQLFTVDPFEASFTGGVYVTTGDVDGDGVPDVVISPDEGGGPRVRLFSGGKGFTQVADFYGIDDINFRGGARAGVADLNGDGSGDLVVAAGFGGGPRVAVFSGKGLGANGGPKLYPDFYVFEDSLRNGAFVTSGDVDGDGVADLIAGGGPGGGPRVTIFSGADLLAGQKRVLADFFAFDPNNRGGVRVVARDLDGDNKADLVAGAGTGAGSTVTAVTGKALSANGNNPTAAFSFDAFPGFSGGVYVG